MNIPTSIQNVLNILYKSGYEAYLVGGCVRDHLMGLEPHDFDITTNATPDEMLKVFSGMRVIETGIKHGTVTVVSDGENVEITTYRIDGKYVDNRHPETVSFTRNLCEDLSRRDFTVNAIAYSPYAGFVDIYGGMEDIKYRLIKCVGAPDLRFNEDGLRLMRALRFASTTRFDIEKDTAQSIHDNIFLLNNISVERIYTEFKKLLLGENVYEIMSEYCDVFFHLLPLFKNAEDIYFRNIKLIPLVSDDIISRISCLFFGFTKSDISKSLKALKPDNYVYNNTCFLTDYLSKKIYCDEISVRYVMKEVKEDNIPRLIELKGILYDDFCQDTFRKEYQRQLINDSCVKLSQLKVNGNDIISLGFKGAKIGEVCSDVLNAVIENRCINDKKCILDYIMLNFKL